MNNQEKETSFVTVIIVSTISLVMILMSEQMYNQTLFDWSLKVIP